MLQLLGGSPAVPQEKIVAICLPLITHLNTVPKTCHMPRHTLQIDHNHVKEGELDWLRPLPKHTSLTATNLL